MTLTTTDPNASYDVKNQETHVQHSRKEHKRVLKNGWGKSFNPQFDCVSFTFCPSMFVGLDLNFHPTVKLGNQEEATDID